MCVCLCVPLSFSLSLALILTLSLTLTYPNSVGLVIKAPRPVVNDDEYYNFDHNGVNDEYTCGVNYASSSIANPSEGGKYIYIYIYIYIYARLCPLAH